MDLLPIPYFGMIMSLLVAPALTFGFIALMRHIKADVEKLKYRKEILELEIRKEELHLTALIEENRKADRLLGSDIHKANEDEGPPRD